MFQYLPENNENLVAIKTSGKLNKSDLDTLLPYIENTIKQFGKINFLWEMESFEGWEPLSFVRDQAFDVKHAADFRRIAMVGDKKWEERMAQVMKPFTKAQLRYFDKASRQQALEWVGQESQQPSA